MTREEIRNNTATNYGYAVAGGCIERGYIQDAFERGAEWADAHPVNPWHKTSEELPEEDGHRVIVRVGRRIEGVDHVFYSYDIGMVRDGRWRLDSQGYSPLPYSPTIDSGLITHWMEIPELPKED